jgi:hypothetical protein
LAKDIATTMLSGKTSVDTLDKIYKEIATASYTTSNPETIIQAHEAGLVGEKTASMALGFSDTEFIQAREDHLKRIIRLQQAQTNAGDTAPKPGARGVDDLAASPVEGKEEKKESRDTTLRESSKKPVRGEGRDPKTLEE